jgi:MinD-like ATPase involved in chromosome partitioning or flagellar assembly
MAELDYVSLAFVSGKGGVGKTTLATNLAWFAHSSTVRVMIIDLDFQNLGATGLFSGLYNLPATSALELLHGEPPAQAPDIYEVETNLFFLPGAFTYDNGDARHSLEGVFERSDHIRVRLKSMLDRLHQWYKIDCFVMDCHGGIDSTSIAAAGICDTTLIVTEADSVTFAGTLALLDSYLEHYKDTSIQPKVEFIVNRIPSKYRWKDLDHLYRRFLKRHLGRYTPDHEILSYIPSEKFLADSFGDYPFQVKLAESVLFSRKIMLILYDLFNEQRPEIVSTAIKSKLHSQRKRRKIQRAVTSAETRSVQQVFTAFSLGTLGMLIIVPVLILGKVPWFEDKVAQGWLNVLSDAVAIMFGLVIVFYLIRAFWRVCGYFRSRLKFKAALFRALPIRSSMSARMELWKLRTFYFSSGFGAAVMSFYFVLLLFAAATMVIAGPY